MLTASDTGPGGRPERHCAVIGSPITHSLSPVLHRAAYDHLRLPWTYGVYDVDVQQLPEFLAGRLERLPALPDDWRGLSLTMPLKRAVIPLLDEVSAQATAVGAANTVLREDDGRLIGDNTDVAGFVDALSAHHLTALRSATIIGGGATATGAMAALARLGVMSPVVVVRDPARAGELVEVAATLGVAPAVRSWATLPQSLDTELVVATTPAGVTDNLAVVVAASVAPAAVLFEVVYDPWPTPLAAAWKDAGGSVIGGLDLLVHQAVLQVELMTGRTVPAEVLRSAGEAALRARLVG